MERLQRRDVLLGGVTVVGAALFQGGSAPRPIVIPILIVISLIAYATARAFS